MQNYIYGAGGHGKVVLDAMQVAGMQCAAFVDDKEISIWAGLSVYHLSGLDLENAIYLHLAIGNCRTREAIASRLIKPKFFTVSHPTAVIAKTATVGLGTFLAAQSIIAPDAVIGNHCIVNHAAVVDHDCIVGDFTHIAPQCCLGGGVKIGRGVFIGTGAVVLPGLTIENYAVIGAGAVVTKNVAAGVTLVGNPAKPIQNQSIKS
jgi:sugar O-acyltransferase (sialic acid O-acetyltransferase NeuD family)